MNSKERLFLTGLLSVQLAPALDRFVPKAYQAQAVGYLVLGLPLLYHGAAHFIQSYGPRIMARVFPQVPAFPTSPQPGATQSATPGAQHP